jgi:threonine dehydrogenase-like Zn-dependent dehydrogenase
MTKTMKAVLFEDELRFVRDRPMPRPAAGEALVRVIVAGICNTDIEILKGYMGFRGIIGHEFVGLVEECAEERLLGRRVVGEINAGCGRCDYCLKGLERHCPARSALGILGRDGAMAEYLTLPLRNLHVVPDGVADEEAVFAEPLAAAFEISEQVHVVPSSRVLVMGDGKLGLLAAMALGLACADVTVLGKHGDKLEIAARRNLKTAMPGALAMERAYDVVVEATGTAGGLQTALGLVRPRGTVVLKSTVAGATEMNLSPIVIDEITVVGSRCGPFAPALRALAGRLVDVRPLVTGTFPFERAREAFERARRKGSLKVLLDFR